LPHHLLHAERLALLHPRTRQRLEIVSASPGWASAASVLPEVA
jgi:hypothetical protein